MDGPLHWPLLTGVLPAMLLAAAIAAFAFLLLRRGRPWWIRVLPAVLIGAATAAAVLAWVVDGLWRPFPDVTPPTVWVWLGIILAALGLAAAQLFAARWWRKAVAVLAVLIMVAAGANQVNRFFGYYPTLAAALGQPLPHQAPLPPKLTDWSPTTTPTTPPGSAPGPTPPGSAPGPTPPGSAPGPAPTGTAPGPAPTAATWQPPAGMPMSGVLSEAAIPGAASGFAARSAWVYLPPAYLTTARPPLPVLMLISGQPGAPRDWIDAGHLASTMDRFAAAHQGLAPIVVIPDATGSNMSNPLCMDSALGRIDTYLTRDVPAWIAANLQVDPTSAHWAIGGFSYGGTCALQLATNHPQQFPTFLDISGQQEPTLGNRQRTVQAAFHGDAAAFASVNPLDILARSASGASDSSRRAAFAVSAGILAVGREDRNFAPGQRKVQAACTAAGLPTTWLELPGGHNWYMASAALESALPWLARRMGLTR